VRLRVKIALAAAVLATCGSFLIPTAASGELRLDSNPSATTHYSGPPDSQAPVTTASDLGAGWLASPVAVDFQAVDDVSGVNYTEWMLDGAEWTQGNQVVVTGDGQHTVAYRSVDVAGNCEVAKSLDLLIDASPPITAARGVGLDWVAGPIEVVLHPSDAESGVARTDYTVDGVPAANTTGGDTSFTIRTEGTHMITWRSTDNVGNTDELHYNYAHFAWTAPSAPTIRVTDATKHGSWYATRPGFAFGGARDPASGILGYYCRFDGSGLWASAAGALPTLNANGKHTIDGVAVDFHGNLGAVTTLPVWLDTVTPVAKAPWAVSTSRGRTAALPYIVNDSSAAGIEAYATIVLTDYRGNVVLRATVRNIRLNRTLYYRFACGLAHGKYRFTVFAQDGAGRASAKVHNSLVVR
jgi:hypothetical protein